MTDPLILVGLGVFFLLCSLLVAVQAHRRGYPLLVWLVAGTLGNPIFLLILLGIMPDFRRKNRRKQEMADLEDRLRLVSPRLPGVAGVAAPLSNHPIGAGRSRDPYNGHWGTRRRATQRNDRWATTKHGCDSVVPVHGSISSTRRSIHGTRRMALR